jgi:hypothetical protein
MNDTRGLLFEGRWDRVAVSNMVFFSRSVRDVGPSPVARAATSLQFFSNTRQLSSATLENDGVAPRASNAENLGLAADDIVGAVETLVSTCGVALGRAIAMCQRTCYEAAVRAGRDGIFGGIRSGLWLDLFELSKVFETLFEICRVGSESPASFSLRVRKSLAMMHVVAIEESLTLYFDASRPPESVQRRPVVDWWDRQTTAVAFVSEAMRTPVFASETNETAPDVISSELGRLGATRALIGALGPCQAYFSIVGGEEYVRRLREASNGSDIREGIREAFSTFLSLYGPSVDSMPRQVAELLQLALERANATERDGRFVLVDSREGVLLRRVRVAEADTEDAGHASKKPRWTNEPCLNELLSGD